MSCSPEIVSSIKEWLSVCDNCHAACANTSDAQSARPTWLIDVQDQCIVPGNAQGKYIALSYTWLDVEGQSNNAEHMQLLSSNLHSMKMPDKLSKEASKLPNVIKDAISLTTSLGERWLWVDRLCIVQDGPQKELECMRMDKIYSGAYMTIAAAAQGGLFSGLQNGHERSESAPESIDVTIIRHYHRLELSRWATRAWTYQEYIFSRRVVFFLDTEVFWQCEIATWDQTALRPHLDEQATVSAAPDSVLLRRLETPSNPDFSIYVDLICPYNGRQLSYEEDGLSACLGILNKLEPAFPGGFTFGLPRFYLDHALLWQPLKFIYYGVDTGFSASGVLSDGCAARTGPSIRRPSLPSWSWCGWQCFVDPESFRTALNLSRDSCQKGDSNSWVLQNLVTWKPTNSDRGLDKGLDVRSNAPSVSRSFLQLSARVPSASCFSAATLSIRVFPPQGMPPASSFVGASVNPVLARFPLCDLPRVVVVQDLSGQFSGLLRVTGNSTREEGQEMKLIAISRGSAIGGDLNQCFEAKVLYRSRYYDGQPFWAAYYQDERWVGTSRWPYPRDDKYRVLATGAFKDSFDPPIAAYEDEVTYDFFNVLWVEDGDDGVSYRAGCGYVLKDRWEGMAPIETDITLG